ncbi:phosphocholine-specific phospholipase C [Sphingobacterium sp. SYP-B4668]|uniref:phosphocholine-specific phospholipase C n=1 Tax=Sphingobacterium sp. SYP-B4668 TaxID=2996035 RepID=UPI0022DD03B7|nr:phospholipase C, phosphocholine-specific [Sphingobacterium sp. SYP-B4668]
MDNRRDFLKKAAMLAGGMSMSQLLSSSIAKAMAIDPQLGSTFQDAEHVVLLMQENRSFDHAFGTLQGVRGFNDPRAILQPNGRKVWLQRNKAGQTYAPFRLDIKDSKITWMGCLPHNWPDQTDARNQGKMDRWLEVKSWGSNDAGEIPLTMGHYTREDIPFYYSLADAFTVCDQHFCSSLTGTNPNRLYFWTGNIRENLDGKALVWNGDSEFSGKANWKTFPERLSALGVDWKIYQNEISSSSAGYAGEANSWLGNFGCNVMEYYPQYEVKYSKRYRHLLEERRKSLEKQIQEKKANGSPADEALKKLEGQLQGVLKEQEIYTPANFDRLSEHTKDIHKRAFVNNSARPDYMELEKMEYQDGDMLRSLQIPKGDILHQFREDVKSGSLPTVSWLAAPQLFSDHPDSPWFGAWYVSEVMNILTQNPEVWKKTIFILTYDENDGYFDHVAPFAAPNPYRTDSGKVSSGIDAKLEYVRKEDQYYPESGRESNIGLGYRVPLVVASPWSRGGWVNSQIFDHTSPLQFLEKFVGYKLGKEVKETNISEWRRTVCGDLTSIFRPYHGEAITKPVFLERKPFYESIHQAKFKDLPKGFKALTEPEIEQIQDRASESPYFPKQEKGIRDSCALPYELGVNGVYDATSASYRISFEAANKAFGAKAAGSAFTVYHHGAFRQEEGRSWNYAVKAGDRLEDTWSLADCASGHYHLSVHGPNGFYRSFKGGEQHPQVHISCAYEPSKRGKGLSGRLICTCTNMGAIDREVVLEDKSYGQSKQVLKIKAGKQTSYVVNTARQHFWYDLRVTCKGFSDFEEQFAGRVESGIASKTDPLMGMGKA